MSSPEPYIQYYTLCVAIIIKYNVLQNFTDKYFTLIVQIEHISITAVGSRDRIKILGQLLWFDHVTGMLASH